MSDDFVGEDDEQEEMSVDDESGIEVEATTGKVPKKEVIKDTKKKKNPIIEQELDYIDFSQKSNAFLSGKKLTARQKALYEGDKNGELFSLPIGKKEESKEMTEEMLLKKSENARRRKMMQQRQQEQEKASTIEKLLKKQTSSRLKKEEERRAMQIKGNKSLNSIRYSSELGGSFLSFVNNVAIPAELYQPAKPSKEIKIIFCAAPGCKNVKKYADRESMLPLCSLNCN